MYLGLYTKAGVGVSWTNTKAEMGRSRVLHKSNYTPILQNYYEEDISGISRRESKVWAYSEAIVLVSVMLTMTNHTRGLLSLDCCILDLLVFLYT